MPLNPTGSEIPRSLTQIGTTIDAALNGKADFVRLTIPPTNADVPSEYELSGSLSFDGTPLTTPITLTYTSENVWENGGSSLLISDGKWQLSHEGFFWQSVESAPATLPEACTFNPTGSNEGTPVFTFTAAVLKTPGQFALVDNNTDDPVLWENLGTDASPDWKVSSGKADFVRLTANPGASTSVSYYVVSGGDLAYDGTPVANGPPYLNFLSANRWESGNANEAPGLSSLQISNGYWQLDYGQDPAGTWISNQTTATRPENCTWSGDGDTSGTPILTFFPQTIRAIGQFALVDDGTNPPVMWQNLGDDTTPEWEALNVVDLSSYAPLASPAFTGNPTAPTQTAGNSTTRLATTAFVATSFAPLASPALTGNPTAPTQTSGNNSTRIATTAFVAAGYQPIDSDLTAIAALTTTSTGRALLTESVSQTGTGALVRAASPTFTGTLSAAAITASGRIQTTSTENASSSFDGALRVAGGMSAQLNIQSGGTIRGRDLRSWQPSSGTIGWNNGPLLFNDNGTVRLRNEADTEFRHLSLGNLTASGTLGVGGGTVVANILSATATLDFPSISSNDTHTLTITVTGAVAGDSVFLGCPAGLDAGLIFCASVTAANTVTVRMHNSSGGSIDPASGTFRATVIRF